MKERIEAALSVLLGLPLTDCWRPDLEDYQSLQIFEFGAQRLFTTRKGEPQTFGEYALHIGCPWRILGQGRILVAYTDLYFPADNPEESGGGDGFECYTPGASRRDRQVTHFVERLTDAPLIVESLTADAVGSVFIALNRGYQLEILPMDSLPFEFWRLAKMKSKMKRFSQFVVSGQGIEEHSS